MKKNWKKIYIQVAFLRHHIHNTAVRLVAGSSRRDHVTSLLRDRRWLPVKQRVEYKLCMMVHRCLYGDAPSYLAVVLGDQSTWPTCMEQTSTTASSRLFICYF